MAKIEVDNDALVAMLKDSALRYKGFALFMSKYGRTIYWHIRRIVVDHEDAEDAMQETAINVLNNIDSFNENSALSTWVYRIATNEALRVLRRRTHIFQSVDTLGETLVEKLESESDLDAKAVEMLFQKALLQLPTQQRIAFNMRYYDELPYEEIARITGKNVSTLKTNYHIAQNKIKQYIKDILEGRESYLSYNKEGYMNNNYPSWKYYLKCKQSSYSKDYYIYNKLTVYTCGYSVLG